MFMVVNIQSRRFYVAAIYKRREDAETFVERAEKRLEIDSYRIDKIGDWEYPFFLLEKWENDDFERSCFLPLPDAAEVRRSILWRLEHRKEPRETPEGHLYMNIYHITEDFHGDPNHPGRDYMGALEHEHVDDDWLDSYESGRRIWP